MDGRRPDAWKTHAALLVVQFAYASQAVEAKIAMGPRALGGEGISPEALAMMRMIGAAIFFQLYTGVGPVRRNPTTRKDQLQLAGLSILGIALNQSLFLIGLRLTTATSAALLGVTIPVFTAALATVFGYERGGARLVVGLTLAISGVLALTGITHVDKGVIFLTANSLSYSSYVVFSRGIVRRLGAMTVVTWIFLWAALFFLPMGGYALYLQAPHITLRGAAYVGYIIIMPTIVAYLANAWALGRSTASLVTVYIYMQPLIAAVLARIQLGEALSSRVLLAAPLIITGVSVVATRRRVARAARGLPGGGPR